MTDTPIPTHYVIRTTAVRCAHCGTTVQVSEFFAHYLIAARYHTGSPVHQHKYCTAPEFDLEVRREPGAQRTVAFCASCRIIDLSHLPPAPQAALVYDLADVALKHAPRRPPSPPAGVKPTKLSIKDLA